MLNKYKYIFWDWNGTLLDDAEVCLDAINTLLIRRSLPPIRDLEAYRDIFDFPVKEFYRRSGFDFDREPFEIPAAEYIKQYHGDDSLFRLFDGAAETLAAMNSLGMRQIILSASEMANLRSQVKLFDIEAYFDEILGISDIYAVSKINIGLEYIRRTGIDAGKAVLIGDTVHDHEVVKAMGMDCIFIAKGHQHREKLLGCGVTVLEDIRELTGVIN